MLLSDTDILGRIAEGDITIVPLTRSNVQPASYDLTVGETAVTRDGPIALKATTPLCIGRGETVAVYPTESLTLSLVLAARFGLSSGLARKGIILLSGLQIDPGFSGKLEVVLFNAGHRPVYLVPGEGFVSIEFEQLSSSATCGYRGGFQNLKVPNSQIIEIITSRHKTFADFEEQVGSLEAKYSIAKWILTAVFVAILAGLISGLAKHAADVIWPNAAHPVTLNSSLAATVDSGSSSPAPIAPPSAPANRTPASAPTIHFSSAPTTGASSSANQPPSSLSSP